MIDLSNCSTTNWLSEGLTNEEIEEIKKKAKEEAELELKSDEIISKN